MGQIMDVTYGSCIFQEQVMAITRVFGGRTDGGADKFRKAIAKKDKTLVLQEADKLYQEIIDNGYEESVAKAIRDDMAEKGGYGLTFNWAPFTGDSNRKSRICGNLLRALCTTV